MSAPRVIVRAVPGLRQLQAERVFQQSRGHTIDLRWQGTESECQSGLDALVLAGGVSEARIQPSDGGMYVLTVTYAASSASDPGGTPPAGPEAVTTVWTREGSITEKTLWNYAPIRETLSILTDEGRANWRAKAESFWRNELSLKEWVAWKNDFAKLPGVTPSMVDNLAKLDSTFAAGTEAYRVFFFQIRRTQIGPPAQLIDNDSTTNAIWSRNKLISDPTMPIEFKNRVPNGVFLQAAPQISQLDSQRWQVVTEWDHADEFNTWLYGQPL